MILLHHEKHRAESILICQGAMFLVSMQIAAKSVSASKMKGFVDAPSHL